MDILHIGVPALLTWQNLTAVALGCCIGLWSGALPGLGGLTAQAMLLPLTYNMDALTALLLLTSVHTSAEFGGSISAILMNVPGDATAAATAFDGYPMARQGKASLALGISTASSLFGALAGTAVLIGGAQALLGFVIKFGPPEYFALGALGVTVVSAVSSGSFIKGLMMTLFGVSLGFVGVDSVLGLPRFTFGVLYLQAGLNFVPVVTGLFGLSELMFMVQRGRSVSETGRISGSLWEGVASAVRYWSTMLKSLAIGVFLGVMPGIGATATNFLAYTLVQKTSRRPETFGKGNPEGIVAPEVANNACIHAAMIPALTLGVPAGASSAMLIVVLTVHGLRPGQMLFSSNALLINGLFAGLVASALISFLLMTVFIRIFARVTIVPIPLLAPVLLVLSLAAAYSAQQNTLDLIVATLAGVGGYVLRRAGFPLVNLVMGLLLGRLLEISFVQARMMSGGSVLIFLQRPVSATVITVCLFVALWSLFGGQLIRRRATAAAS